MTKAWLIAGLISTVILIGLVSCQRNSSPPLKPLVIATYYGDQSSLLFVAQAKGYFAEEGLEVTLKKSESGATAVDEVTRGTADLATAADFVFVKKEPQSPGMRIFSSISRSTSIKLYCRSDRQINEPSRLAGKRVALPKETAAEYFFETFCEDNRIAPTKVQILDTPPSRLLDRLPQGDADCVAVWNPIGQKIKATLGPQVTFMPLQGEQSFYFLLIGSERLSRERRLELEHLHKALRRAEAFMHESPGEAEALAAGGIGMHQADLHLLLQDTIVHLDLSRGLMLILEGQSAWLRRKSHSSGRMPNYLQLMDLQPLQKAYPEAVTIIH